MRIRCLLRLLLVLAACAAAPTPHARAQYPASAATEAAAAIRHAGAEGAHPASSGPAADSLHVEAERAAGLRILVSLSERRLWLRDGAITLHTAPVGIGKGTTLRHEERVWSFATPRGRRRVLSKAVNPVWVPPEWHYVELAQQRGFALAHLSRAADTQISDGRLRIRGDAVVHADRAGREVVLPPDEEIVFDGTLYVPPIGTVNRRIPGELGRYKLDLGDGYLIHGTPEADSVGGATTHGCLRLRADDLELLFQGVPVGTPVYIF